MLANPKDTPKLDPRVRRTRQWLQEALERLLAEKSFEAITVQDIAQRAGVNRVTFYAHFNDKYALLEYTMRMVFEQKLRAALPEGAPFSSENLARLIRLVAEHLVEIQGHCPAPRGQMDTLMEKQVKTGLYEVLFSWLNQAPVSRVTRHPTPEQAAMMTSWAIYGAAVQWSQKDAREPAGEFARQVLPLILAGLQPLTGALALGRPASNPLA